MSDLNHQEFATVQSNQQKGPRTVAAAATIAPESFITHITGTTPALATITPPVSGAHMLIFIWDDAPPTVVTTGNILTAVVPTIDLPTFFFYDPILKKYYGCASNVT